MFSKSKTLVRETSSKKIEEGDKNKQKAKGITFLIVLLNSVENLIIFLLTINAIFFPNFISAIYMIFAMFLTFFSLTRSLPKIETKRVISIIIILIAVGSFITKLVYLL